MGGGAGIAGNVYIGGNLSFLNLLKSPIYENTTTVTNLTTNVVEFTGIPSWVKVIEICYYNVGHNSGTAICPQVLLGTSGGYATTFAGNSFNQTGATSLAHGAGIPIWYSTYANTVVVQVGFMQLRILPSYQINVPPLLTYRPVSVAGNGQASAGLVTNIIGSSLSINAQTFDRIKIQTGTAALFTGLGASMQVMLRYY